MYCKSRLHDLQRVADGVLIVAKCIVNLKGVYTDGFIGLSINSSKVYCK